MNAGEILVTHRAIHNALTAGRGREGLESVAAVGDAHAEVCQRFETALRTHLAAGGQESVAAAPAPTAEMVAKLSDALAALDDAEANPKVMTALEDETASLLQSYLAEKAAAENKAEPQETGGFEAKFDDRDFIGWGLSFFDWWRGIVKHAWQPPPAAPDPIPSSFRVGILADWGTGLYGAPVCAKSLQADPKGYQLFLHLGDVYYSGTPNEVAERFLKLWPESAGTLSRALNSNHEMYTGGHAYYNQTLQQFGQSSSCFAVQNNDWLLVGLDSAYADHDLAHDQGAWLEGLVAAAEKRKVVLFCHHQPYSLFESQGPKLVAKLDGLLSSGKIFAWYWGHEHRCVVYDRHPLWNLLGRCIGHSGYPYFRTVPSGAEPAGGEAGVTWYRLPGKNLVPGGRLLDGPNPYVKGQQTRYGPNGYVTLEFDGPNLVELFHIASGEVVLQQKIA